MSEKQTNQQPRIVPELSILDDYNKTLFEKDNYIIPLYQRAFAWGDNEINQLIDDINDCEATTAHYYIGSLVVHKDKNGKFEVIDGQQRLTALFLLLNYLGYSWEKDRLSYECREQSNHTLNKMLNFSSEPEIAKNFSDDDKADQGLIKGRGIINDKFTNDKSNKKTFIDKTKFIENLKKVRIYRIEVPDHTDLNRYFEIMNVRGEQLEQHDILKANLMRALEPANESADGCIELTKKQELFAKIWDVCSDMSGYVQMHFKVKDREQLFDSNWNTVPSRERLSNVISQLGNDDLASIDKSLSMLEILSTNADSKLTEDKDYLDVQGNKIRFKSIMEFPYFLLHVLKVFVQVEHYDNPDKILLDQLDDKKLLQAFTNVIDNGTIGNDKQDRSKFSEKFILCLLKCRFLFDKYIIKREYQNNTKESLNDDDDGIWSLKELFANNGKPQCNNTNFDDCGEENKTSDSHIDNLMLQSCLRVSYTSPKVMHWITKLLSWLYNDDNRNKLSEFNSVAEQIMQEPIKQFLDSKANFYKGVEIQHAVFNYLDYVLWTKRGYEQYKQLNFDDFTFGFRNSVEHWYPQNPSEVELPPWDKENQYGKEVDGFGNLCLVHRSTNSKFSNLKPTAKKGQYENMIKNGSLKLRLMSQLTKEVGDLQWREFECAKHCDEMISLLKSACNLN